MRKLDPEVQLKERLAEAISSESFTGIVRQKLYQGFLAGNSRLRTSPCP